MRKKGKKNYITNFPVRFFVGSPISFIFLFIPLISSRVISFLLFTNLFIRVKEDKNISKGLYKRFYFDITTVIFLN